MESFLTRICDRDKALCLYLYCTITERSSVMENERVCPVCGCELVPTQVPTEECDDLLFCCYSESCDYQVASKALV